jgi:hypothetical protein
MTSGMLADLSEFFEHLVLTKETFGRTRRNACEASPRGHVVHNTARCGNLRAFADREMWRDCRVAANHGEVSDNRRAGYPGLRCDKAVLANDHVVSDLDKIVDLGSGADDRVSHRPAIDSGLCSDFDIIAMIAPPICATF